MTLALEATPWCGELEWPEKVGDLLEMRSHSVNLVDDILHAVDAKLPELRRDDLVIVERDAALVHLAKAALVDELTHSLERRIAICDIWLHCLQHLKDGLVDLQEDAIVHLLQAHQLQDFAWLRCHFDDTLDACNEQEGLFWLHKEVACGFRLPPGRDELSPKACILLVVLQCPHLQ